MANWQMRLDFSQAKRDYQEELITIKQVAQIVVKELNDKLQTAKDIDLELGEELEDDILPYFEEIAEGDEKYYNVHDFDNALEMLYDWADISLDNRFGGKKMCWVVPA